MSKLNDEIKEAFFYVLFRPFAEFLMKGLFVLKQS
ncbi:hypothetical protein EHR_01445 [Enterococcus hirae ATCC 9790]|uniref:Uncharacterized protein n=1 Tax=Enterococcus hirae (strain ATCC 9790 / DSM 20160 / JCM 8729 / LMG 6399 / NBRC 3181 / NCIMB 6459 / NCDO 1258 / NCTC 12367 / WDCM 00089 / R) TaxID=768486 RepID=I6T7W8_ENTHA|nr:hypothetical protein EHR_01445 [Enterococcus hirae ATCC 9790]